MKMVYFHILFYQKVLNLVILFFIGTIKNFK